MHLSRVSLLDFGLADAAPQNSCINYELPDAVSLGAATPRHGLWPAMSNSPAMHTLGQAYIFSPGF